MNKLFRKLFLKAAALIAVMATVGFSQLVFARTPVRIPGAASLPSPGPLINYGGPVQSAPKVYIVFWGWTSDPSGEAPYLQNFLSSIGGSNWLATGIWWTGGGFSSDLYGGSWSDSTPIPTTPTDAQIQNEALAAVNHFGLGTSVNYQIVVATPTGHSSTGFGVYGGYCAYHDSLSSYPNVTYTNFPYQTDAGAACGANSVRSALDGVSIVEGHELAEAITDPLVSTSPAWVDANGLENGDKCAWYDLNVILTSQGLFAVQPLWSNWGNACVLPKSDRVVAGQTLRANQYIRSGNGVYTLYMQADGNLVLYKNMSQALWATHTESISALQNGKGWVYLQADGNFVLYDQNNNAYWSTRTHGHSLGQLIMQNDGNLVLYDSSNTAIWASNTVQ